MTEEAQQLALFASSGSSSTIGAPSSPRSSEPTTSSNVPRPITTTGAVPTTPSRHVAASSMHDGVDDAGRSSSGATSTAGSGRQRTLQIFIAPSTEARTLDIPRPRNLAECAEEARPCPWAGCRHHLLFEVSEAKERAHGARRPRTVRLNTLGPRPKEGRRAGLSSSSAAGLVQVWIDEGVELLSRLEYTCTFDFVRDYPDGAPEWLVARVLGVSKQHVGKEVRMASARYREHADQQGVERDGSDDDV